MSENIEKRKARLATRDARRVAQREVALQPIIVPEPRPKNWITVGIGAGGTAVWIALVSWSYTAGTVGDFIGAGILLVMAFLVAVAALMVSERYGGFVDRKRVALNLCFAVVMAATSCMLFWWEYAHKPTPPVTADDIAKRVTQSLPPVPAAPTQSQRGGAGIREAPGSTGNRYIGNVSQGYETGYDLQGSNAEVCKNVASKGPLASSEIEAILRSHPECRK